MDLLHDLRTTLARHADVRRAAPMQRYMKSVLPFYGIQTPLRRRLLRRVADAHPLRDREQLAAAMRALWREARFREERYCAIELARTGANRKLMCFDLLPVFRDFLVDGAWWDFGDDISGNALAQLLQTHPGAMTPVLLRWANGRDLWLRRAAILVQRKRGADCDAPLLYACILPSLDSGEFFLRKGIGWALRERARAAPDEVRAFCAEYRERMAPLTRREALKHIGAAD